MVVLAMVLLSGGLVHAESMLERLVLMSGSEWVAGRWVAETDDGETATLVYCWELDKNMISVRFEMHDYSYKGMIYCLPYNETVTEVGVDNKGSVSRCQWDADYYGATSHRQVNRVDGQTESMVIVSAETGKDAMKMEVYGDDYGSLSSKPWATLNFKRQTLKGQDADQQQ